MRLSIVVPVYNEIKTISEILRRVLKARLPKGVQKEIIVVDDGSSDGTREILKKFKHPKVKIFYHPRNLGKGSALRTGFSKVTGEIVTIQDADLEYNPEDFSRLIKPIIDNHAQVVYGNRFANYPLRLWGANKTVLPTHWVGNRTLTLLTSLFYGVWLNDMETCYKLLRRDVLQNLKLKAERFDIEPEITSQILKKGIKIIEIPIQVEPRTHSEGKKISWRDGFAAILTLIKYRFQR